MHLQPLTIAVILPPTQIQDKLDSQQGDRQICF